MSTWMSQLALHDLPWSPHITNCCNKTRRLTRILYIYRRFYRYTNSPSLLRLYKSFIIDPMHLDYAFIVWNPHLKGEIESVENVQKFAL